MLLENLKRPLFGCPSRGRLRNVDPNHFYMIYEFNAVLIDLRAQNWIKHNSFKSLETCLVLEDELAIHIVVEILGVRASINTCFIVRVGLIIRLGSFRVSDHIMSRVRFWELITNYFLENRDVDCFIVVLEFLWSESLLSPVESAEMWDDTGIFVIYLEIIDASRRFNIVLSGFGGILKSRVSALRMIRLYRV
ncbi:hypothetical protein BPOR_1481g00010 [Botrytis porri]|uniref:Uncharacterized protein n=1 Tax=Botrytis porri TaxID=87229 RepID=A0A4Z1K618_9HELO|nr:hypothetical protein BPOR_1481g00010 [Botrytis porri]